MKKAELPTDELRAECRREDFVPMVRGKYAAQVKEASNVVVLDPEIAAAFPNAQAVNETLRSLFQLATTSARNQSQATRPPSPPRHIG